MDRIGRLEVWSVLAHDYGLYGIAARLERMGFKPSPLLRFASLDDSQLVDYAEREHIAQRTGAYSSKLGRG